MCVHVSIEDIIFIEDTNTFGMEVQTRLGKIFGENMEKSLWQDGKDESHTAC